MAVVEYVRLVSLLKTAINRSFFDNVFIIQSQGVFKNRIGSSRGSDAQLNHSGLHSVCKSLFRCCCCVNSTLRR